MFSNRSGNWSFLHCDWERSRMSTRVPTRLAKTSNMVFQHSWGMWVARWPGSAWRLRTKVLVWRYDLIGGVVGLDHLTFPAIHERIDAWIVSRDDSQTNASPFVSQLYILADEHTLCICEQFYLIFYFFIKEFNYFLKF